LPQHGGAGWTRTSDNAIMSRALYHLSYGTAQAGRKPSALKKEILSCGLRPRLELALLRPPLGQRHSFPFVHDLSIKCGGAGKTGSVNASRMVAEVGFEPTQLYSSSVVGPTIRHL
jgi:hypothetical protein